TIVGTQDGLGLHNDNEEGIEHFVYVDGRSQPLFLLEDIDAEENATDGIANWDPAFPLEQVIVPVPASDIRSNFRNERPDRELLDQ
ncbi:hypothetical protein AB9E11_35780, partial [Rhizobium leguminosarum]